MMKKTRDKSKPNTRIGGQCPQGGHRVGEAKNCWMCRRLIRTTNGGYITKR